MVAALAVGWSLQSEVLGASPNDVCADSLQSLVDRAGPGSNVAVPRCLFRETVTVRKPLTLVGTPGAEIRGSDVWTEWKPRGSNWVSDQSVPEFAVHGECRPGTRRCHWPEQVFIDGVALDQVEAVPGPGAFAVGPSREIVLGDNPAGRTVEVSTRTRWVVPLVNGVTVAGFRMRHAANDSQTGALDDGGYELHVRDCQLSDAHGAVVWLSGRGTLVGNDISRGGQLGVGKGGSLVSANRIYDNNTEDFDPGWEAGGLKAVVANQVVESNEIFGNDGSGIWYDSGSSGITIRSNRVHDNNYVGIFVEVSSDIRVTGNAVWENGTGDPGWVNGAGILVHSSARVEVDDNIVAWNADGIGVESQSRRDRPPDADSGIDIHDNAIFMEDGPDTQLALSWVMDWRGPLFTDGRRNGGANNSYWYEQTEGRYDRFAWNGPIQTLAAFNATPAEENARYLSDEEGRLTLAQADMPLRAARIAPGRTDESQAQNLTLALVGLFLASIVLAAHIAEDRGTVLARGIRRWSVGLVVTYLCAIVLVSRADAVADGIEGLMVVAVLLTEVMVLAMLLPAHRVRPPRR